MLKEKPTSFVATTSITGKSDLAQCLNWLADKIRKGKPHRFTGVFTRDDWGKSFFLPMRSARKRDVIIETMLAKGYLKHVDENSFTVNKSMFGDVSNSQFWGDEQ